MGLFGSKFSGQNALDFALGGTGGLDRRRAIDAQAKYQTAIDARNDPILSAVFAANPKAAAESLATNYGYHNLSAGDQGISGLGGTNYNPRQFNVNDQLFQTKEGGGVDQIGTVAPSFSDITARQNADQPRYQNVGPGDTLYELPKTPYGSPDAVTQPQAGAAMSALSAPGSLAQRNNNPGNLRPDGSQWQGMTGQSGGFVQFDTPENGQRAARINLANQAKLHGINTLSGLISKYAPATDGNDPQSYIATVARQTGIDPNAPIDLTDPAIQDRILPAMFAVEGGGTPSPQAPVAPPMRSNAPRVAIQGAPKPTARPATVQEKAAYGIPSEVPAQMKPDGSIDVVSGVGTAQKPLPAQILKSYTDNNAAVAKIDRAIAAVQKQPQAFGIKNNIPLFSRYDQYGVEPRAKVADIGSLTLHDRSGAAVTASEYPRLAPFIPQASDPPNVVLQKLRNLRENVAAENQALEQTYGPDTGYRPLSQPTPVRPQVPQPRKANSGPAVGTVQQGYRFKGGNPADPKSWAKVQ